MRAAMIGRWSGRRRTGLRWQEPSGGARSRRAGTPAVRCGSTPALATTTLSRLRTQPRMSRPHHLVALVLMLSAAACGHRDTAGPVLAPLARLADGGPEPATPVALSDEWRIALGGRPIRPLLLRPNERVPADGRQTYTVDLPSDVA